MLYTFVPRIVPLGLGIGLLPEISGRVRPTALVILLRCLPSSKSEVECMLHVLQPPVSTRGQLVNPYCARSNQPGRCPPH
jgi:hypothetical protein